MMRACLKDLDSHYHPRKIIDNADVTIDHARPAHEHVGGK